MENDKNKQMLEYLTGCEALTEGDLFFNYAEEDHESNHIITIADDKAMQKPYIDGSIKKQYTFNIVCYRPLSHNPLVDEPGFMDENVENIAEVNRIIDWIIEQEDSKNYPDFGEKCIPDSIYCLTDDPDLFAVDVKADPPIAKYSIIIRFEYIDQTKMIFT